MPVLSVRDLGVTYTGGITGCADISFDVMPGEILGLVGESGSGKSTVLGAIALTTLATRGSALFQSPRRGPLKLFALNGQERRGLRQPRPDRRGQHRRGPPGGGLAPLREDPHPCRGAAPSG